MLISKSAIALSPVGQTGFKQKKQECPSMMCAQGTEKDLKSNTLEAKFSTRATMEFLKSVPAVRGRLVTSVMSCCPSGHMARKVGSTLKTCVAFTQIPWQGKAHLTQYGSRNYIVLDLKMSMS